MAGGFLETAAVEAARALIGPGVRVATKVPEGKPKLPLVRVEVVPREGPHPWVWVVAVLTWVYAENEESALELAFRMWARADEGAAEGVGVTTLAPRVPPALRPDPDDLGGPARVLVTYEATIVA